MRTVIVAGPRRGKSTLALELRLQAALESSLKCQGNPVLPIRCGDPRSKVKDPMLAVDYLPEGLAFYGDGGGADWISLAWFGTPGPWVCEGHVMARALRRWMQRNPRTMPCDRIIVLDRPAFGFPLPGQEAMHKGCMTVWAGIEPHYRSLVDRKLSVFRS